MNQHTECLVRIFCLHPSNCIPPKSPVSDNPIEQLFPRKAGNLPTFSCARVPQALLMSPFFLYSSFRPLLWVEGSLHTGCSTALGVGRVDLFYFTPKQTHGGIGKTGSGKPLGFVCPGKPNIKAEMKCRKRPRRLSSRNMYIVCVLFLHNSRFLSMLVGIVRSMQMLVLAPSVCLWSAFGLR